MFPIMILYSKAHIQPQLTRPGLDATQEQPIHEMAKNTEANPIPSQKILNRENKEIVTQLMVGAEAQRSIYMPLEQPSWAVYKPGKHRKPARRERKTKPILRKKRDLASGENNRLSNCFSSCCTQGLVFSASHGFPIRFIFSPLIPSTFPFPQQ